MNRLRALAFAIVVGAFGALLIPRLLADDSNKRTVLTISEPVHLPGVTLQPGTYVMKLLDSVADRHIVQVFNADESHLITTVLAIPNYRLQATGTSEFAFWETPPGQPKALRAWFFPPDNLGQEFAYPRGEAATIASTASASVPTTAADNESQLKSAPVATVNQQGEEKPLAAEYQAPAPAQTTEVAQSTPPAPAPEAAPDPAPASTAASGGAERSLPKTSSPYPLIALAGLLSLGLFATVRLARIR